MKAKISCLALGLLLSVVAVQAQDTNRWHGGSYDGWDRQAMTAAVLLDADVSLSSGADQVFDWTQASATLAALTITATDPAGKITNGGTMRISLPSGWQCRFDAGSAASYSGTAAGKVGAAAFTGDGRALLIPVTADFVAADTLTVSGLKLVDLRLVSAGTARFGLDFTGEGVPERYDLYTVTVRVQWPGGSYDGWDRQVMTAAVLLGPDVSLSSGADQVFDWVQASAALAAMTITATDPAGTITNGGTMRISLPSGWQCRFDAGPVATYSGTAAGKVGAAAFTGDGRALLIPVTADFVAADTLTVSGLKLVDLRLASAATARFGLNFTGEGVPDRYDLYTMAVRVQWPGGSYDGWDSAVTAKYAHLAGAAGAVLMIR